MEVRTPASGLKGPRLDQLDYAAIIVPVRFTSVAPTDGLFYFAVIYFLSGLLATSSISKGWLSMTPSVMPGVVERVNPCLRPLVATGL